MAEDGKLKLFDPTDAQACAGEWEDYKRQFEIHLDSMGLHDAPGRRKVGQLLRFMGKTHIDTYDTFTWAEEIAAVDANAEHDIEARARVPAEDRYNLETVFTKFDAHFGVHRFRSIKRQEFLHSTRGPKQTIMSFISELKGKARHCNYGASEEGMIVDMLINKCNDSKCTERLMELADEQLTINNATRICRQVELTQSHLKSLTSEKTGESAVHATSHHRGYQQQRGRSRGRGGGRGRPRGRGYSSEYSQGSKCAKCCRQHDHGYCKAAQQYCGRCGQKGHFQKSTHCPANQQGHGAGGRGENRG